MFKKTRTMDLPFKFLMGQSEKNLPIRATFRIDIQTHRSWTQYDSFIFYCNHYTVESRQKKMLVVVE